MESPISNRADYSGNPSFIEAIKSLSGAWQETLSSRFCRAEWSPENRISQTTGSPSSLELEVVDCTVFNREPELFGPKHPYVGADRGSPLNNFLARKGGESCIVFLDEFEKTTSDIHKALLLLFDNGENENTTIKVLEL